MSGIAAIIILIVSIVITSKICNVINRNTIGTTGAYAKRGFIVFVIVFFALLWIYGNITGYGT